MSKSEKAKTIAKWTSNDEYKSNYDRIFNTPKDLKDVEFKWGGDKYKDKCDCSGDHYNSEVGYVTCSYCGTVRSIKEYD